ncbi:MAG TPA: patatin-like phospholipase family protein [Spirochaetota bacterium]|nr:patatin-like phospholipase family protein [Spirochaetota bacterium]HPI89264.1 patatin-like phospholipase family protein [Spirochaetota bacterium]HPR48576.1 patatin-like phospholipase family protein [Spirochaetota bacterium]
MRLFRNTRVGLALGSGGAKGMAHIGVIEYLQEMGIPIDMIAGSSIGAVIGALYCSGGLASFKNDLIKMSRKDLLGYFDPVFPTSGLLAGKEMMSLLFNYIPENTRIENFSIPLAVLATDYNTGRSVIFRSGNVHEAIRASISIPGVFTPVRFRSTHLIDGGVAAPLPVNVIRGMGAGLTIAVNLHPSIEKRKWNRNIKSAVKNKGITVDSRDIEILEEKKAPVDLSRGQTFQRGPGWFQSLERWIRPEKKARDDSTPNIFEVIGQTIDIMEYINTQMLLKYNTPTVLVEPEMAGVGTLDFTHSGKIIAEGRNACARVRGELSRKIKIWV